MEPVQCTYNDLIKNNKQSNKDVTVDKKCVGTGRWILEHAHRAISQNTPSRAHPQKNKQFYSPVQRLTSHGSLHGL